MTFQEILKCMMKFKFYGVLIRKKKKGPENTRGKYLFGKVIYKTRKKEKYLNFDILYQYQF